MGEDKKRLRDNINFLFLLQAGNYFFPLITIPYLVRVLGPTNFGLFSFAQALINYFILFTDYGFNLSATQDLAKNKDSPEKINNIFSSVFFIKIFLIFISFITLLLLTNSFEFFNQNKALYLITYLNVIGNFLFPVWFFQGMEQMRFITYINLFSKIFFTLAIFIFIKKESDYVLVAIIQGGGNVFCGLLSSLILIRFFSLSIKFPSFRKIYNDLKEGWIIFKTTAATNIYTTSSIFILGLISNQTVVGYYSGADKLIKSANSLLAPLSQAIFPYVSNLVKKEKHLAISFLRKTVFRVGVFSFFISVLILIFSKHLVHLFLGPEFDQSVPILRILAFTNFFISLSNILGIQTMLNFGYKKEFSRILTTVSIFSLFLIIGLTFLFGAKGMATGVLFTEFFVLILMVLVLKRKNFALFTWNKEYA